jgi:transposase
MPTPKPLPVVLTEAERQLLTGWARRRTTAQALALRSRIVLACADNANNGQVAEDLGVSRNTVSKWRNRFVAQRLEGLSDEPRPGAPRTITDEQVEQVIVKTLEEAPSRRDTHWSTRSMAAATGMSQTADRVAVRAHGAGMRKQIDVVSLYGHGVRARLVFHVVRGDDIATAAGRVTGLPHDQSGNRLDVAGGRRACDGLGDLAECCVVGVHSDAEPSQIKILRRHREEVRQVRALGGQPCGRRCDRECHIPGMTVPCGHFYRWIGRWVHVGASSFTTWSTCRSR